MIVAAKIIFIVFMRVLIDCCSVLQGLSVIIVSVGILVWSRSLPRKLLLADCFVIVWT